MRGLRSTLVLLVVALGLGAYIYFVERHRPAASETEPNETLFTFDAEDVAELHVTAENGAVTELQRADGSWQVVAPVETAGDDNAASSIASTLASLEIRRVVEEGPADLEPFGLDEPALDVGFTLTESDTKQHLLIGDQTPTGTDRYAKLAAQDRVFLIAGYLDTTFDKTTFDLRDKTILEFKRDDLDGLEITNAGQTLRFTKDGDDWLVSEPWNVPADFSTVEGLIGSLSFGTMQAVEAESAEDLEPFGLADPTLTVAVTAGSATATLLVGHEAQDGTRYARDESRSLVFTVAASLASDLERDAGEYRRKDLFRFRPFNARWLEVEQAEGTVAFEKTVAPTDDEEDRWTRVEPESADVARAEMDDLLAKLSNLRARSFVESRPDAGLRDDDSVATIRVRFGDDDIEEHVVVWKTDEETYAVQGDEPGAAQIDTQAFDDAIAALAAIQTEG